MKCTIAPFSGFCKGVTNTISAIEGLLAENKGPIYCIGLPVHNPQITNRLIGNGLHVVNSLDDISSGTLVIRAHGLPPRLIEKAKEKGLSLINTTCPIVSKAQHVAESLYKDGFTVLITGEKDHPEVQSIYGYTNETGIIISSLDEVQQRSFSKGKIGVLSQTTFSEETFRHIARHIVSNDFHEVRIVNTICASMHQRTEAAKKIAQSVDCMLILGGKMSANTKRLFETCRSVNTRSYHIETKAELETEWFARVETVGITAGASTPQWLLDELIEAIHAL